VNAIANVLFCSAIVIELVTALSLLYLYHRLGTKNRKLEKQDSQYTMRGLINHQSMLEGKYNQSGMMP
jgi:hypothetical protein